MNKSRILPFVLGAFLLSSLTASVSFANKREMALSTRAYVMATLRQIGIQDDAYKVVITQIMGLIQAAHQAKVFEQEITEGYVKRTGFGKLGKAEFGVTSIFIRSHSSPLIEASRVALSLTVETINENTTLGFHVVLPRAVEAFGVLDREFKITLHHYPAQKLIKVEVLPSSKAFEDSFPDGQFKNMRNHYEVAKRVYTIRAGSLESELWLFELQGTGEFYRFEDLYKKSDLYIPDDESSDKESVATSQSVIGTE